MPEERVGFNCPSRQKPSGAMFRSVGDRTKVRGPGDTRPRRILTLAIVVSVVIHGMPIPLLLASMYLRQWLGLTQRFSWSDVDHPTVIPIDLEIQEETPSAVPEPPVPTLTTDPESVPAKLSKDRRGVSDAGPDAAPDAKMDAQLDAELDADTDAQDDADAQDAPTDGLVEDVFGPSDATFDILPSPLEDAAIASRDPLDAALSLGRPARSDSGAASMAMSAQDAGGGDARAASPIRDPVGLAGAAGKVAPQSPNVSLLIYTDRIRKHPLAQQFGPILASVPQWDSFFAGTHIDPIQDTDRILLAGPQFRDSSRIVAVVQYNVPQSKVKAAVSALVTRSGSRGAWLDTKVPAAKAYADRADRFFVFPSPKILAVVPSDGLDQALKLKATTFPRAKNEAVVFFLKTPRNAFRGLAVRIPESIEWTRCSMTMSEDGGADVHIEAKDQDPASAMSTASTLSQELTRIAVIPLINKRLLDPVTFRAEGNTVRADIHLSAAQLRTIFSLVAARLDGRRDR